MLIVLTLILGLAMVPAAATTQVDSEKEITASDVKEIITRETAINLLEVQNAQLSPNTNDILHYEVTEEQLERFYEDVAAFVTVHVLEDFFSSSTWTWRYSADYGEEIVSLTLKPTDYMLSHTLAEEVAAVWVLVVERHSHSKYWENEGSLEQQFYCHALGEKYGHSSEDGTWDLEPIRPDVGLIEMALAECNPV